jgi:hypothetical protein
VLGRLPELTSIWHCWISTNKRRSISRGGQPSGAERAAPCVCPTLVMPMRTASTIGANDARTCGIERRSAANNAELSRQLSRIANANGPPISSTRQSDMAAPTKNNVVEWTLLLGLLVMIALIVYSAL